MQAADGAGVAQGHRRVVGRVSDVGRLCAVPRALDVLRRSGDCCAAALDFFLLFLFQGRRPACVARFQESLLSQQPKQILEPRRGCVVLDRLALQEDATRRGLGPLSRGDSKRESKIGAAPPRVPPRRGVVVRDKTEIGQYSCPSSTALPALPQKGREHNVERRGPDFEVRGVAASGFRVPGGWSPGVTI